MGLVLCCQVGRLGKVPCPAEGRGLHTGKCAPLRPIWSRSTLGVPMTCLPLEARA